MAKLIGLAGVFALVFAIVDLIHGPHNGDVHRDYIHIAEFIFFFGFLCLLEIWAFRVITTEANLNRWLLVTCFSFFSCVVALILFGLVGGSFHGDGGPIAFSFLVISAVGEIALPISLIGFAVVAISRKRNGIAILDK